MAQYVHIGIFLITVPNLIVIVLMLLVFALAVALPLPQWHTETADRTSNQAAEQHTEEGMIR
jgi:fatty acid desaturase